MTLSGYVRDAESGEDLIGASVSLRGKKKGALTNAYGFYTIEATTGATRLVVRYSGYQQFEAELNLTLDTTVIVRLNPLATKLKSVEVVAGREESIVKSTQMSISTVDMQVLKKLPLVLGEADPIRALQLTPGVTVAREGAAGFNVRGGSPDQNLVLLDEATIFNTSHLFGFFSVFNADAIKNVELYKGGVPARFGGRLSSVLDVRQKEGNQRNFGFRGGLGLISSRLLVEGPLVNDRSSFMVAGRRSYADLFLPLASDPSIRDNVAYFYDLNAKANVTINNENRVFLSGYFGRDKFGLGSIFGNTWGNASLTARWNHLFSDKLFMNVSGVWSVYDYQIDVIANGIGLRNTADITNQSIKTDLTWYVGNGSIDAGFELIRYQFQPGRIDPIGNSSVIASVLDPKFGIEPAIYVEREQKVGELVNLRFGFRYSGFLRMGEETILRYQDDKPVRYNPATGRYDDGVVVGSEQFGSSDIISRFSGFEPRFAGTYLLSETSSIKASYQRTRQYIHLISNTVSPTPLDIWLPSGPYLEPQTADQVALGYATSMGDKEYEFTFETYYKRLTNQVDFVDGAELRQNNNIEREILSGGTGRAFGAEFYLKKNVGDVTGWISYTLARTERRIPGIDGAPGINGGEYFPSNYDKTHDLSVNGFYQLNDSWSFAASFVFASGVPLTFPESRYNFEGFVIPHFSERNRERLPVYHRFDVSATLEGAKSERWETRWIFSIYNLYNRQNAASIFFRPGRDNPSVSESVRLTIFGIVPSVTWEFKY